MTKKLNKLNKWSNIIITKNINHLKESTNYLESQIEMLLKKELDYRKIYELNKEVAICDMLIDELKNELKRRNK